MFSGAIFVKKGKKNDFCSILAFVGMIRVCMAIFLLSGVLSCHNAGNNWNKVVEISKEVNFCDKGDGVSSISVDSGVFSGDYCFLFDFKMSNIGSENTGDILSVFGEKNDINIVISTSNGSASCTSMGNYRNILVGIQTGEGEVWQDLGRPGNAILAFALSIYDGDLYVGTYEVGGSNRGHVYKYVNSGEWEDCGAPGESNAITSLAVFNNKLYAASSRYHAGGSDLPESPNQAMGGYLYRYEGGQIWSNCGKIGPSEFVYGMTESNSSLFLSLMDSPRRGESVGQGLYSYRGDGAFRYYGNPGGRVAAIAASRDGVLATGYDGGYYGGLFRFSLINGWINLGTPSNVMQSYGITKYNNNICIGTWPFAEVFAYDEKKSDYFSLGKIDNEKEVMSMMCYNGFLYAGTLPSAAVYRLSEDLVWEKVGVLDSINSGLKRAWGMSIYDGRLICSTLPSGHIFAMSRGSVLIIDKNLDYGWHKIEFIKTGDLIQLYCDNKFVSKRILPHSIKTDFDKKKYLKIGLGPHGGFRGSIRDFRLYSAS